MTHPLPESPRGRALTIGSLFSGIGGLELGLERAGLCPVIWQVEKDPSCLHWLAQHWPDAEQHGDVRKVHARSWCDDAETKRFGCDNCLLPVDVLCGGFPCQPHSVAGKREGSDDERDLWPEYARIIRELRPRYVVAENVPGLLTSDDGRFFNRVLSDLAALGYDAEWGMLSAEDVGAPQLRERLFTVAWRVVADANSGRREQCHARLGNDSVADSGHIPLGDAASGGRRAGRGLEVRRAGRGRAIVGNTVRIALDEHEPQRFTECGDSAQPWADGVPVRGADGTVRLIPREAAEAGPESPLWPVADGLPGRVARLRAIGNAVVPQVAEVVGRVVLALEAEAEAA